MMQNIYNENKRAWNMYYLELRPWSLKTFETWKDGLENKKPRSIKQTNIKKQKKQRKNQKTKQQSKRQKKTTKMNYLQKVES